MLETGRVSHNAFESIAADLVYSKGIDSGSSTVCWILPELQHSVFDSRSAFYSNKETIGQPQ